MPSPESMDWAASYAQANKLFEIQIKSNGYPVEGQPVLTPAEKARILMELAAGVDQPVVGIKEPAPINQDFLDALAQLNGVVTLIESNLVRRAPTVVGIDSDEADVLLESAQKLLKVVRDG